ncbi:MAG: hypothetical protein ACRYF3_02440 [Janthinobacterium lividum]
MTDQPTPVPRPAPSTPARTEVVRPGSFPPGSSARGSSSQSSNPQARDVEQALDVALRRLSDLEAVNVHEHVEIYGDADRALRARLASTEV